MMIRRFGEMMQDYCQLWFHKRNIIIISEQKVKHIPISGKAQFLLLSMVVGSICWASYSTGSYMAARSALKEERQTLRSVASVRVDTNFNPLFQMSPLTAPGSTGPVRSDTPAVSLSDPMYTLAALDHNKLFVRIALLEHKVVELKNTNEAIVRRVSDTTSNKISNLESIIRKTGLNPDDLKKQLGETKNFLKSSEKTRSDNRKEGGPYIPAGPIEFSQREYALFDSLEQLAVLRQIVDFLPLSLPIKEGDEQSGFGTRIDPFTGRLAYHSGLDIAGPAGSKIYSTADGRISAAGTNGAYGNAVDIDHGFGLSTRYGHMSQILVKEGQIVKKGEAIGIQGSTGRSTGPHVHYEVRYNNQAMNPVKFLDAGEHVSKE